MPFLEMFKPLKSPLENKVIEVFSDIPTLETKRLILSKIVPENVHDMYEYSKNPDITKYLTWSPHLKETETERYIKLLQKKYERGSFYDFGLNDKQSGRFIGTCGFTSFDYDNNTAEIGYVLSPDFHGKGYATEAARCVMEFGFEKLGLSGFCAKCMEGNCKSTSVMSRLFMSFEAMYKNSAFIKGEYKTIIVYSVTKEKYYEHKNRLENT